MKRSYSYFLLFSLGIALLFTACKGDKGDIGPAGQAGQAGVAGTNGTNGSNGINGNANITQINYGTKSHAGTDMFLAFPTSILASDIDKSIFYVYLKQTVKTASGTNASFWFSVPGEIANGNEYSFYVTSAATVNGIYVRRVVNFLSGNDAFDDIRVIVAPSSTVVKGGRMSINFKNYEEVRKAFNLPK